MIYLNYPVLKTYLKN